MAHITEITISGYRAISEPVTLKNLGPYVAVFGDNAVGKSSVLRAVALLGRVARHHAQSNSRPIWDSWPPDAFFGAFDEDPWMFNDRGTKVVLTARLSTGDVLEVAVHRPTHSEIPAFLSIDGVGLNHKPIGPEERSKLDAIAVGIGASPRIPIPDPIRAALHNSFGSHDPHVRRRARNVFGNLRDLFPALGDGAIELLINPPNHEKDLAWVSDTSAIPLDHLGGGVQSAIGTLGALVLADANVVCLEEPEAFVGARALDGIARIFREAAARKICEQVWIATHSVALVAATDPIVILERENGIVTARQGTAADLGRFAQPAAEPPHSPAHPFGRLGADGSVKIPDAAIRRHGLRAGDIMFFRDNGDALEIVPEAAMHAALEVKNAP